MSMTGSYVYIAESITPYLQKNKIVLRLLDRLKVLRFNPCDTVHGQNVWHCARFLIGGTIHIIVYRVYIENKTRPESQAAATSI